MPKRLLFFSLIWILFFGFPAVPSMTRLARANQPPVWSPLTDMVVPVGQLLQFLVSATDPEGQPLNYNAYQLPVGADFNSDNKVFSWTPAAGQEGNYEIIFRASDGTAAADLKVNIIAGNGVGELQPAPTPTAGPSLNQEQTAQAAAVVGGGKFLSPNLFLPAIAILFIIILLLLLLILRRH